MSHPQASAAVTTHWRDAFSRGTAGTTAPEPTAFRALDPAWTVDASDIVGLAAVLDSHGRICSVGPNASLLWSDRDRHELVGQYLLDQLTGESVGAAALAVAQSSSLGTGRATVESPDGSGFVELISSAQTDDDGAALIAVFAYRVPAPQILSSAPMVTMLLQLAVELDAGFIAIDDKQRLTFVNALAAGSIGFVGDPTTLHGTPASGFYDSIARLSTNPEAVVEQLFDAAASDKLPQRVEFELLDGRWCRGVCATTAAFSKSRFWVLRFSATPTVKTTDAEAESQRSELVRLHEQKSAMLYTASHEVRNSLHGILGLVEELRETSLDPDDRILLSALSDACSGLRGMVQQVLDVAQLEAGTLGVTSVPFDVRTVIREVGAVVAGMLTHKDVELSIGLDDDVEPWRLGDPGRLGQILTNLATNAAKAADRGVLGISVSDAGVRGLRFVIGDTGPGMPKFARDRLTEPLPKEPIRKNQTNHGLGLLIARELIELLNGSVEVSVEPGIGTTVVVVLPLPSTTTPAASSNGDEMPSVLFRRALLVDDSPEALDVLRRSLRASVESMDATVDCRVGLELGADQEYDLVIVDGTMTPHDGADMVTAFRKMPTTRDAAIVVATANAGAESSSRYLAAGADLVLVKPFAKSDLQQALHQADARRRGEAVPIIDLRHSDRHDDRDIVVHPKGVKMFESLLADRVQALLQAYAATDVDAFTKACHNLGSPAVTVGALRLGRLCLALETVVRTVGLVGVSRLALDEIEQVGRREVAEMLGTLTV